MGLYIRRAKRFGSPGINLFLLEVEHTEWRQVGAIGIENCSALEISQQVLWLISIELMKKIVFIPLAYCMVYLGSECYHVGTLYIYSVYVRTLY